jgi:large subunit ribosomal protein L10
MALDRQTKERLVADYSEGFAATSNAFIVGFRGISVPEADDLRSKVRESGARYQVVKNRLALIAVKDTPMECLAEHFEGPTAVAFSEDDVVGLAKVLTDFAKESENDVLEFRAGLLDGSPVAAEDIREIASLPGREELVAKLLFLLQSPIVRLARGLGAITQQFVSVLEQVRQQKESQS